MFGILQRCGQLVPTSDTIGSLSVSVLTWHWLCGRLMQLCLADPSLQRTLAWGSWIMIFRWKRSGESQEEGTTVNIMWATQQRDHKKPDIDFRSNVSIRARIWQPWAASWAAEDRYLELSALDTAVESCKDACLLPSCAIFLHYVHCKMLQKLKQ